MTSTTPTASRGLPARKHLAHLGHVIVAVFLTALFFRLRVMDSAEQREDFEAITALASVVKLPVHQLLVDPTTPTPAINNNTSGVGAFPALLPPVLPPLQESGMYSDTPPSGAHLPSFPPHLQGPGMDNHTASAPAPPVPGLTAPADEKQEPKRGGMRVHEEQGSGEPGGKNPVAPPRKQEDLLVDGDGVGMEQDARLRPCTHRVACTHLVPCQHPVPCQHTVPCQHAVPCSHVAMTPSGPSRMHAFDTIHRADVQHPADAAHQSDALHPFDLLHPEGDPD